MPITVFARTLQEHLVQRWQRARHNSLVGYSTENLRFGASESPCTHKSWRTLIPSLDLETVLPDP